MARFPRRTLFLLLLLLTTLPIQAKDWNRYTSDHLTIYSDQKESKVTDIIDQFESFRQVVLALTGLGDVPENQRLQILLFKSSKAFKTYAPENSAGFYFDSPSGPWMVVGPGAWGMDISSILYHEYVHYLLHQHALDGFPKWYDEGYAEFLGATYFKKDKAVVGGIQDGRILDLQSLDKISVADLLEPENRLDSERFTYRFYATAWLMTHYLLINATFEEPELIPRINTYISRYRQGGDPIEAFESSFELTTQEMDKKLSRYLRRSSLSTMMLNSSTYEGNIDKQALNSNEEAFLLANLAWQSEGNDEDGLKQLGAIDTEQPGAARAMALKSVLLQKSGKSDAAEESAESANTLESNSADVLALLAEREYLYGFQRQQEGQRTEDQIEQSINLANQALSLDPQHLEALHQLARANQVKGDNLTAIKAYAAAYQFIPSSIELNYNLALLLIREGYDAESVTFLKRAMNWTHSEDMQRRLEKMLEAVNTRLQQG